MLRPSNSQNVIGIGHETNLRGIEMTSPDIRAIMSLLIASMSAESKSSIHSVEQIDRGYQFINKRLNVLRAEI